MKGSQMVRKNLHVIDTTYGGGGFVSGGLYEHCLETCSNLFRYFLYKGAIIKSLIKSLK